MALMIDGLFVVQPQRKKPMPSIDMDDRAGQTRIPKAPVEQFNHAVTTQMSSTKPETTPSSSPTRSFTERQNDIDSLATASPAAAQAMRQELVADVKSRISEIDNQLQTLPTDSFSGYVRPALQAEQDEIRNLLPRALSAGDTVPSFAERQQDIDSLATASPAAAQAMRQELVADIESRIAEIDSKLQNLPNDSFSGYVRPELQAERDELWGLMPASARAQVEWYEDTGDGIIIVSERFTAGGEVEVPTTGGAEVTVGAAVDFQKNTAADGSVTVKATINGTLGAEVANTLGLNVNGSLGTEYQFANELEAQQFIDAMKDAVDDKFRWSLDSHYLVELGPVQSVVDVINEYSDNHSSYKAGLELEAEVETGVGGHRIDVSAAAGVERKFETDLSTASTTYYARLSASTGADLGLGEKFGLKGDTQVRVTFDNEGNASTLTILGSASGSTPVRGVINSFDVVDGTDQDFENVIPGNKNNESVAANVAITLDISNPQNPLAVAELVNSMIGNGDQPFGTAATDIFDRAEVRVGITTTESSAISADVENFEFKLGNSEVVTVAAFAKPPHGDFQQVG